MHLADSAPSSAPASSSAHGGSTVGSGRAVGVAGSKVLAETSANSMGSAAAAPGAAAKHAPAPINGGGSRAGGMMVVTPGAISVSDASRAAAAKVLAAL